MIQENVLVFNEPLCSITGKTREQRIADGCSGDCQNCAGDCEPERSEASVVSYFGANREESKMRDRSDFLPLPRIDWTEGQEGLLTNLGHDPGPPTPLEVSEPASELGLSLAPLPVLNEADRDRTRYLPLPRMEW